jgi:hypothetical protein
MKGWYGKLHDMTIEKLDEIVERTEQTIKSKQADLEHFKKIRENRIKALPDSHVERYQVHMSTAGRGHETNRSCVYADCGWCYNKAVNEDGCIGIENCMKKYPEQWGLEKPNDASMVMGAVAAADLIRDAMVELRGNADWIVDVHHDMMQLIFKIENNLKND